MIKFLSILALAYTHVSFAVNVTFLNPATPSHEFWQRVTTITEMAANDLNMNLTVDYGNDNRVDSLAKLSEITSKEKKPDYLLFMPYTGNALQSFQMLEDAKIKFYSLERSIPQTERERLGEPGGRFKYWLGEVYHDNVKAGEKLAQSLLLKTKSQYQGDIKQLISFGITGDYSGESYDRSKGLINIMMNQNRVKLRQVIHANWNPSQAIEKYNLLTRRYGNAQMVWAASDTMALAIANHISSTSTEPLFIGGFDWLPETIEAIKEGKIAASVGGHVFLGAWSLVKAFDHSNGVNIQVNKSIPYEMSVIDNTNTAKYQPIFVDEEIEHLDFKQLSLLKNPKQRTYNFNVEAILEYMSKSKKMK